MITKSVKIILFLYLLTLLLWTSTVIYPLTASVDPEFLATIRSFTQIPLAVIPFFGGILGLKNSFKFGGFRSLAGRSSLFVSLGLLAWSGGMIIWNYYMFFTNIEVPYPSIADAIFILSQPLWILGIWQLTKIIGVKFALKNKIKRIEVVAVSVLFGLFSIYLSGTVRQWDFTYTSGIELFFSLFYPISGLIVCTLAVFAYQSSRNVLGGIFKLPVSLLLIGLMLNYVADTTFFYVTVQETYFNGHFADFAYATAMFMISLGIVMLNPGILNKVEQK